MASDLIDSMSNTIVDDVFFFALFNLPICFARTYGNTVKLKVLILHVDLYGSTYMCFLRMQYINEIALFHSLSHSGCHLLSPLYMLLSCKQTTKTKKWTAVVTWCKLFQCCSEIEAMKLCIMPYTQQQMPLTHNSTERFKMIDCSLYCLGAPKILCRI